MPFSITYRCLLASEVESIYFKWPYLTSSMACLLLSRPGGPPSQAYRAKVGPAHHILLNNINNSSTGHYLAFMAHFDAQCASRAGLKRESASKRNVPRAAAGAATTTGSSSSSSSSKGRGSKQWQQQQQQQQGQQQQGQQQQQQQH